MVQPVTMYRPPSRAPVGAWATHLHAQRRERRLSQVQAFELTRDGLHLSPKSKASYAAIDMGDRQPRPEEAEYLARVFGWPPEGDAEPESAPTLAAALSELAGELRASRQERDTLEERLRTLEAAVQHLAVQAGAEFPARSALGGSAG